MIDWDGLVLGPTMAIFGQPIAVNPVHSLGSEFSATDFIAMLAPPASTLPPPVYGANGIFKADPTSIPMDDGSVIAATIYTLGVRLSDYLVPIAPDDQIAVAGMVFSIDRVHPDGQGGATLTLKRLS